jgi:hypothetical protein
MTDHFAIAIILFVAFVLWFALHRAVARPVLIERSYLAYLKQYLQERGIETSAIPDAALFDIVKVAKILSAEGGQTGRSTSRDHRNGYRPELTRALEAEATLIVQLIITGSGAANSDAAKAFRKHRVSRPGTTMAPAGMTAQHFTEAAKNGTLYVDLEARRRQRESS